MVCFSTERKWVNLVISVLFALRAHHDKRVHHRRSIAVVSGFKARSSNPDFVGLGHRSEKLRRRTASWFCNRWIFNCESCRECFCQNNKAGTSESRLADHRLQTPEVGIPITPSDVVLDYRNFHVRRLINAIFQVSI
jgi:hypothetical protein